MRFINPAVFVCLALQCALFAAPDSRACEPGTDSGPSPKLLAPTAAPDSRAGEPGTDLSPSPKPVEETAIDAGIRAYEAGNYASAAASFREAIKSAPQDATLHHWLGKSYGRIAEQGNWFTAFSYAKKTLKQFRKAVQLDADNYEALRDLADYLEQAPGFMGGSRQEAQRLRQRLEKLHYARGTGNE